ncbi:hypothetical protein CIB48_g7608 [Xylaria polymorpha]|nr:hypothetical protein CIB48_g7608 [Xylaria polymorpha]
MPQFIFIELPTFRIKDKNGNTVTLSSRHLGRVISLLQYVRSCLRTSNEYTPDLAASFLFSNQETNLWSAMHTPNSHHAEENLLLSYFNSFDSPGAFPIVDAMLLRSKPCGSCMEYFSLNGKQLRPLLDDGTGTGALTAAAGGPFRAKFTPRVDKTYTPVFYLSRSLDATQRGNLWLQLAQMWTGGVGVGSRVVARRRRRRDVLSLRRRLRPLVRAQWPGEHERLRGRRGHRAPGAEPHVLDRTID